MAKNNLDIEKIESLFNETIKLTEQGLTVPALMYCRKIIEGILFVIQNKENIAVSSTIARNSTNFSFLQTEKHIKQKYKTKHIEKFFDYLNQLRILGNKAAHFDFNDSEIDISNNELKELLTFTFRWFKEFIATSHKDKKREDLFWDKSNNALPFCLKYIEIENYQSLKKVEINDIPVDSKFIVLTGDNGEGKTSILQAIAIGMYGDYDEFSNLVLCDKPDVNISIEAKYNNQTIFNEYKGFRNQFSSIEQNRNLIAYGASRLQLQSSESQDNRNLRQSNVYGIFKTDNVLQNIEYWIKMQLLNKQEARIEAVKKLLIKLMPSIEDIETGEHTRRVFITIKGAKKHINLKEFRINYIENSVKLQSDQLSAGNKSILAMIGDMLIRLYNSQPETIDPKELYGIILIDELETHLHPKWQKEFPHLLAESLPLVQFIVSTHSPMVFLGMPKNTVFYNIYRDKKRQTVIQKLDIDIENVLPHQILTSPLFGMDNLRNIHNKGIENLSVETEQEIAERLKNEKALKKLAKDFKFQLPKK